MTSRDVLSALLWDPMRVRSGHPLLREKDSLVFPELRVGTGYGKDAETRLDAWAMFTLPSLRFLRQSFEVKVSRSDFLAEIKAPVKRRIGLMLSNEFYFVTPARLCKIEEIPAECGLIEVEPDGRTKCTILAPHRDTPAPSWRFMASVTRRAVKGDYEAELTALRNHYDRLRTGTVEGGIFSAAS